MNKIGLMESRLGKLERDNRRLKMAFGVMSLLFATVVFIGMAMPEQIPKVIQAQQFQAVNENGNIRAVMTGGGIVYSDENGVRAFINPGGISYWDETGTERAVWSIDGISYRDENGTPRAVMNALGIRYYDENGNGRALTSNRGFAYSGVNGNIVWSTDCAPNC